MNYDGFLVDHTPPSREYWTVRHDEHNSGGTHTFSETRFYTFAEVMQFTTDQRRKEGPMGCWT